MIAARKINKHDRLVIENEVYQYDEERKTSVLMLDNITSSWEYSGDQLTTEESYVTPFKKRERVSELWQ